MHVMTMETGTLTETDPMEVAMAAVMGVLAAVMGVLAAAMGVMAAVMVVLAAVMVVLAVVMGGLAAVMGVLAAVMGVAVMGGMEVVMDMVVTGTIIAGAMVGMAGMEEVMETRMEVLDEILTTKVFIRWRRIMAALFSTTCNILWIHSPGFPGCLMPTMMPCTVHSHQ
jgi:hypothetical protein